ncbi:MAG: hypothetical protein Q4D16_21540 [Eubacteriales bacterium]|nr:hypothetical protein [Eubacteriales bacterium]
MKLEVFMPLQGRMLEANGLVLNERKLSTYEEQVNHILATSQVFSYMQDPKAFLKAFEGDAGIQEKIASMEVKTETEGDSLYGVMRFQCSQGLSYSEREQLSRYVDLQFDKAKGGYLLSESIETTAGKMQLELWNPYTSEFWMDREKPPELQKYKITDIVHPADPKLHRIQALRDVNETVKEGDLGGYVQRKWNLSQSGTSWIYEDAICEDFARVQEKASLRHHARASGKSFVTGKSEVADYSQIRGYAYVRDAQIKDRSIICGEAVVESLERVTVFPVIAGKSRVRGQIHGAFLVQDTSVSRGQRLVNPAEVKKRIETELKSKKQPER